MLIDYMLAEDLLHAEECEEPVTPKDRVADTLREIFKSESRLSQVIEIRKKIISYGVKAIPLTTEFALWEIGEWQAEGVMRQTIAKKLGVTVIQRKSKKEVGETINKFVDLASNESDGMA